MCLVYFYWACVLWEASFGGIWRGPPVFCLSIGLPLDQGGWLRRGLDSLKSRGSQCRCVQAVLRPDPPGRWLWVELANSACWPSASAFPYGALPEVPPSAAALQITGSRWSACLATLQGQPSPRLCSSAFPCSPRACSGSCPALPLSQVALGKALHLPSLSFLLYTKGTVLLISSRLLVG